MRNEVMNYLETQGYTHLALVEEDQNYIGFWGVTPQGLNCEIRLDKHDNTVWDRTARFWDQIGEVL